MPSYKDIAPLTVAHLFANYVNRKAWLSVGDHAMYYANTPKSWMGSSRKPSMGVEVPIVIVDARISYGTNQFLAIPVLGTGATWIKLTPRLKVVDHWGIEEFLSGTEQQAVDRITEFIRKNPPPLQSKKGGRPKGS